MADRIERFVSGFPAQREAYRRWLVLACSIHSGHFLLIPETLCVGTFVILSETRRAALELKDARSRPGR
jgi:hypothetical protein